MADIDEAFKLFNSNHINRPPIDDHSAYHKQHDNNSFVTRLHNPIHNPIDEHTINFNYNNKDEFQNIVDNFNDIMMSKVNGTNCYSPCSIMYIMLMVYLGSTHDTREEMKKVLNINATDDILYESLVKIE